jgi:MiaB/RimO family radical SAM methylthiotransferase
MTNGCDEGQLKSKHVQRFFSENGFTTVTNLSQADFVMFFACGLTVPKEKQSILIIKKLQTQMKGGAKLIVWGCLPKINSKSLREVYNGPIVGPKDLQYFESFVGELKISINEVSAITVNPKTTLDVPEISQPLPFDPVADLLMHFKKVMDHLRLPQRKWLFDTSSSFLRVAEGCTGNCTYCSERPAWGRVRSRSKEKIAQDFALGLDRGFKRFFLVAADLGSYGIDLDCDLVDLLREILRVGEGHDYTLIINQINPRDLVRLYSGLEEIFDSGKIEAVGCQVESGSNRIIRLMGRKYSARSWRDIMLRINKKFPFIRLSTHIMIGFPGETEEDFKRTLEIVKFPLFIDWIGFFIFSPRPTTFASRLPCQVPEKVKQSRFKKIYREFLLIHILNVVLGNVRYLLSKFKGYPSDSKDVGRYHERQTKR